MPNQLPVTIDFGTLPATGQGYTPQEFANRLGTNGRIFTEQAFALFVTGSTAPTSDVGPWAANGNTWYYWDSVSGSYVPFLIPQASLKFTVGSVTPDPAIYQFWIETTGPGSPLAVKTYFSGAWVDVYATKLGDYLTVAAFNATLAGYSTTAQMNAAIASAVGAATSYPAQGTNSAPQSIAVDSAPHKLTLDTGAINPSPAPFNVALYRYIAPAAGIYAVEATSQFDNDTGVSADMEVLLQLYKNGANSGIGDIDGTPSPNGDRWSPSFGTIISMAANDYLELYVTAQDGVGTNAIDLTTARLSVWRISS